jgi:outer membrane protein assembly factor BamB
VWVANRGRPLLDDGAGLAVTDDGNLKILDKNGDPFWSTGLESTSKLGNRLAKLLDSGNLVLCDSNTLLTTILWQSFDHPTDTLLFYYAHILVIQGLGWMLKGSYNTGASM